MMAKKYNQYPSESEILKKALIASEQAIFAERKRLQAQITTEVSEYKKQLEKIQNSRSWRWTYFMRKTEKFLRNIFQINKPQDQKQIHAKNNFLGAIDPKSDVAVIITCHNYGKFLPDAIESVLKQTQKPSEILIVDDASTDNTADIAQKYKDFGVRYIKCNNNNPSDTRNYGAKETSSQFIIFLDADDFIADDYIEKCRTVFEDPSVAITYGNRQCTRDSDEFIKAPEYNFKLLLKKNFISSHAMIRRQVFDIVGGYRIMPQSWEDWDLYKRMLRYKWIAKKVETIVYYRIHTKSRTEFFRRTNKNHNWQGAGLMHNPITIFTPFAGRKEVFYKYLTALKQIDFNHNLIHLHWFDTSGNNEFGKILQNEMSKLSFGQTIYTKSPLPDLWATSPDELIKTRVHSKKSQYYYELAVIHAYNNLIISCNTEFVLTLEDDIAISPTALTQMIQTVRMPYTVAVVASYKCLLQGYQMVWKRDINGYPHHFSKRKTGIEKVDGAGFGCSLLRMSALSSMPLYTRVFENPPHWYDYNTFAHLQSMGEILCNWDVKVEHMNTNRYKNIKHESKELINALK